MRKKFTALLASMLALFLFIPAMCVNAQEVQAPVFNETNNHFFAKGNKITIEARTDGVEGALIKWDGGEQLVTEGTTVFGADHDSDVVYEKTEITMNGGTVRNIFGGGLHKSHVKNASVIINDGKIIGGVQGGGASSFIKDTDAPSYYAGDAKLSPTKVDFAIVQVLGGNGSMVYGGGEGISCTGKADVHIGTDAGTWDYVIAGGSNGYTGESFMMISGGKINTVQSVNRGSMDKAGFYISGGEIENAYVGGDSSDTSVTGTIAEAKMEVVGGKIANLLVGSNGGSTVSAKDIVELQYAKDTVENIDETTFEQDTITNLVLLRVELHVNGLFSESLVADGRAMTDKEFKQIEDGILSNFEDMSLTDYIIEGYYKDAQYTEKFDFEATINGDTTIYAKLVKKQLTVTVDVMGKTQTFNVESGSVLTQKQIDDIKGIDMAAIGLADYVFEGLYTDSAHTQKFDTAKAFKENTTIYVNAVKKAIQPEPKPENPGTFDSGIAALVLIVLASGAAIVFGYKKRYN